MAIDVNNPLEFHSPDMTTVRGVEAGQTKEIIDELQVSGGQTLIMENGMYVARIEPIPLDEKTQSDLRARHANAGFNVHAQDIRYTASPAVGESAARAAQIDELIEQARQAADTNDQAA